MRAIGFSVYFLTQNTQKVPKFKKNCSYSYIRNALYQSQDVSCSKNCYRSKKKFDATADPNIPL